MEIWPKSTKKKAVEMKCPKRVFGPNFRVQFMPFCWVYWMEKPLLSPSTPSRFGCLNGHPSTRPIQ